LLLGHISEFSKHLMGPWTFSYGVRAAISPSLGGYLADLTKTFYWSFVLATLIVMVAALLMIPPKKTENDGANRKLRS